MSLLRLRYCWHRVRYFLALLPAVLMLVRAYGWHLGYRVIVMPTRLRCGRDEGFYASRGDYTVPPFTDAKERAREFYREHGILAAPMYNERRPDYPSTFEGTVRRIGSLLLPTTIHVASNTCLFTEDDSAHAHNGHRGYSLGALIDPAYKWGIFWIGDPGTLYSLTCSDEDIRLILMHPICEPCEEIIGSELQPEQSGDRR